MQVNPAERYALVTAARNQFCRCRADEIVSDPIESMKALIESFKLHQSRTAKAFHALRQTGRVEDMLEIEDLLRKSAETMADDEWFDTQSVRVAA